MSCSSAINYNEGNLDNAIKKILGDFPECIESGGNLGRGLPNFLGIGLRVGSQQAGVAADAVRVPLAAAARTQGVLERIGEHERLGLGSSLKFCRIAEGRADFYPRFGPTSEWDTAAGQCVLEAAGGAVLGIDGAPLRYNRKASLLNPDFLALGDPDLPWRDWLDTGP